MLCVVQCYDDIDCSVIWWHLLRAQNTAGNLVTVILVAIIGDHLSKVMSFSSLQLVVCLQCCYYSGEDLNLSTSNLLMEINQNILLRLLLKTGSTVVKRVQDTVTDNQAKPSHVALHLLFSGKKNLLLNAFYCHN